MAKRSLTTQQSLKICKKQQPAHQFNSLIKVLKPKVFITNSSNFKTLVQELTGNGSTSAATSSFSPPHATHIASSEPTHVIQIDDHNSPDPSLDHSLDCSPDPSLDHSLDFSPDPSLDHSLECSPDPSLDNMFMQFDYSISSSDESLGLQWAHDPVHLDHVNEIDQLRNLESWLLDFDSSAFNHDAAFVPANTYEYDYNMSSIM